MVRECVVLADSPEALTELCGLSAVERLLRSLQRCGITRATVLTSTPEAITNEICRPSWPRAELQIVVRPRPPGPVKLEQIVEIWPRNSEKAPLLLVVPANSVFDLR